MACSSFTIPNVQGHLLRKSQFLGQNHLCNPLHVSPSTVPSKTPSISAKFNLFEIMGGRGLLSGEKGVEQELKRNIEESDASQSAAQVEEKSDPPTEEDQSVPENAFEKELLGLTGGFPGGEKGLKKFIEENPPPKKSVGVADKGNVKIISSSTKPKPPELPLLMPGMIAIVKNPNHPFYMYCGIVQRITDGKAGVLFEGGNWDRLITFRLEELERREKGPPMKNPKSCVLEPLLEKES